MQRILLGFVLFLFFPLSLIAQETETREDRDISLMLLAKVNQYRAQKKLPPLQMASVISQEAKKHSIAQAKKQVPFGHQGFFTRMRVIFAKIKGSKSGSENVAYGYKPEVVFSKWLASKVHRKNIEGNFNVTGIGIARDNAGRIYYTQEFIKVG